MPLRTSGGLLCDIVRSINLLTQYESLFAITAAHRHDTETCFGGLHRHWYLEAGRKDFHEVA